MTIELRASIAAVWTLLVWAPAIQAAPRPGEALPTVRTQAESSNEQPTRRLRRNRALWLISIPVFLAANVMDAQSSWAKPEANSVLRGQGGRFDAQSAAIKFSISGGVIAGEYSFIHMFKRNAELRNTSYAASAWANLIGAGVLAGAAVHNYQQPATATGGSAK